MITGADFRWTIERHGLIAVVVLAPLWVPMLLVGVLYKAFSIAADILA